MLFNAASINFDIVKTIFINASFIFVNWYFVHFNSTRKTTRLNELIFD